METSYAGCVKAQSGESEVIGGSGNACAEGYAYIGEGKCQVVECKYAWHGLGDARGNNPLIGGKSKWRCPYDVLFGNGKLILGKSTIPIENDSNKVVII